MIIKESFSARIIDRGEAWIDMLEDRNKTFHIYEEEQALRIYKKIKNNHFLLLKEFSPKAKHIIDNL